MNLTSDHLAVLNHRLELGADDFADLLTDRHPDDGPASFTRSEIVAAWSGLALMMAAREVPLEKLTPCELEILCECLEGSTFFCDSDDAVALYALGAKNPCYLINGKRQGYSRGQLARWIKAAEELEAEIFRATDRRVVTQLF